MSQVPSGLRVTPSEWHLIEDILRRHLASTRVLAFGSRATGKPKPYSDLDLAIVSEKPVPIDTLARLSEAFSESDLPWKVDVLDYSMTDESFQRIIQRDGIPLR